MQKVWMYIDGPNFYYSIANSGFDIALGWCDFRKLAENHLIDRNSSLERISYFTAPVGDFAHNISEERRQNTWLDAVRTIHNLRVFNGFYAGNNSGNRKEKQTDVNIAVRLVLDAFKSDSYDTAILVSGDMDLAPAVLAVQSDDIPGKKSVQVCVPLDKPSSYWTNLSATDGIVIKSITADMLLDSRLSESIKVNHKPTVNCPDKWKLK